MSVVAGRILDNIYSTSLVDEEELFDEEALAAPVLTPTPLSCPSGGCFLVGSRRVKRFFNVGIPVWCGGDRAVIDVPLLPTDGMTVVVL